MDCFFVGCHLSSTGGYLKMAQTATKIGANTFQFFTRNPQGGSKAKPLDFNDIENYNQYAESHQFGYILAHAPYTMNLAGKDSIQDFGIQMMKDDLMRLKNVRKVYYNFHPGSHVGMGEEIGIQRIIDALNSAVDSQDGPMILLETMAGKGSEIGKTFQELKKIMEGVRFVERFGVTIDTCHIHDGGYSLKNFDEVLETFDKVIGLSYLKAIHLNDSLNESGAKKDRHARLGEGKIGLETLYQITRNEKLKNLPFILETPNDLDGYAKEIALLKQDHICKNIL